MPTLTPSRAARRTHTLLRRRRQEKAAVVPQDWRIGLAAWCERLAGTLRQHEPPLGQQGVRLQFRADGISGGRPIYHVYSVRGGMHLGVLEWRPQWHRASFRADPDAVFDQQCLAEIFAMLKEVK